MDLDEYRRDSLANWDRISANWADEREYIWGATGVVGRALVERLDPQPGQTVLDLAAGTGDTGYEAAARLGDDGRLISTDFAPAMVEAAQAVSRERGIANVEHRVLDAENMDLDDDSVDGVLCRWGYMLMADPARALAETRRVLRDGGRLSLAAWGPPERNQWAFVPGFAMVEAGHLDPPEPGTPGIFALADPERIRALVTEAGFADPEIEDVEVDWQYPDPDFHWDMTMKLAGPLAEALGKLPEDERERIRGVVRERMGELLEGDPSAVHGHTWVVATS